MENKTAAETPPYTAPQPSVVEEAAVSRRTRNRMELIRRTRNKMAFILSMAHGAVELSLRREPRRVRKAVKSQLDAQYGFKAPRIGGPFSRR